MNKSFVYLYIILINLVTFLAFFIDKRRARLRRRRIPEGTLFLLALLGGGFGAHYAMYRFHHKNRKPIFKSGIPVLIILNVALFCFMLFF